jgi:hypothetical protein
MQFDDFDRLPLRSPIAPAGSDAIGAMIAPSAPATTGSVPAKR